MGFAPPVPDRRLRRGDTMRRLSRASRSPGKPGLREHCHRIAFLTVIPDAGNPGRQTPFCALRASRTLSAVVFPVFLAVPAMPMIMISGHCTLAERSGICSVLPAPQESRVNRRRKMIRRANLLQCIADPLENLLREAIRGVRRLYHRVPHEPGCLTNRLNAVDARGEADRSARICLVRRCHGHGVHPE